MNALDTSTKFRRNCRTVQPCAGFKQVSKFRDHCAKCEQRRVIAMAAIRARKRTVSTCS